MPLENIAHPLCVIENYHIPSMPLFIIFYPLHAITVKIQLTYLLKGMVKRQKYPFFQTGAGRGRRWPCRRGNRAASALEGNEPRAARGRWARAARALRWALGGACLAGARLRGASRARVSLGRWALTGRGAPCGSLPHGGAPCHLFSSSNFEHSSTAQLPSAG